MGQEGEQRQREKAFQGFQVDDAIMKLAHSDCMVQHLSLIHIS